MKTKNVLLSCLVLFTLAISTSFGNKNETIASARAEMLDNIDAVIENVPFEEFMGNYRECRMTIVFTVDENSELTDYLVSSDNESLNYITELHLKRAELKADPSMKGITYRVKVRFINQAYH